MKTQEEQELFRKYAELIQSHRKALKRIEELENVIMKVIDAIILVDEVLEDPSHKANIKQNRR